MVDNIQIVRDFLCASQSGNHLIMQRLLHPDAEVHEAASLPYAGTHRGLPGFLDLVKTVFTTFDDTRVEVETMLGEADIVVVLATLSGRSKHSGESFNMPVNEIWRVRHGQIHSITPYYFDTARLKQLAGTL